jgi:hypothetical protein
MDKKRLMITSSSGPVSCKGLDRNMIYSFFFFVLVEHQGSISAEHGIGIHKVDYMTQCKNPVQLALMRKIKATFDKHSIMNPYKVIPENNGV